MCDGKSSSKRDVVILSIKPKRPDYPAAQQYVPVNDLLQEWDKLDAYYRGQLLKLTKSLSKKNKKHGSNNHHSNSSSKSSPVKKKHSSSASSDQFNELFGDENLFSNEHSNNNRHNLNKLLHSRSLNNLFDDPLDGSTSSNKSSRSRKNSLTTSNTNNLVVSIPVFSVQQNYGDGEQYKTCGGGDIKRSKLRYDSEDEENQAYNSSDDEDVKETKEEENNFLSVPRDNFQVQYGTKQKTRVALLEGDNNVSPRWIVPVHVAPYKPPTAQGLNGVQIQKILYHKNDSLNYSSPTTTTARTPDKPPDNLVNNPIPPTVTKSAKVSFNNSPVSTISPRSNSTTANATPIGDTNNNATPMQTVSRTPDLSSPKSDQGTVKSTFSPDSEKSFSPPANLNGPISSSGLKRLRFPSSKGQNISYNGNKKPKLNGEAGQTTIPTSTTLYSNDSLENDSYGMYPRSDGKDGDKQKSGSPTKTFNSPPKKSNVVNNNKTGKYMKPLSTSSGGEPRSGTSSVSPPPVGISITDQIIKKASMPQPELLERQRRRRFESDKRKSYAMQKGDEHEEKESIELSMKSFEMIWNQPLLSPIRSP